MEEILRQHLRQSYADDHLPVNVLQEARALVAKGRYGAALEKYLWFHRHALEHNPALAGVRLSFALSGWAELGEKYPPARHALLAARDEAAKAFEEGKGPFLLFLEVEAMNRYLPDDAHTVRLFKAMHQADPGLAGQCYAVAERALVEAGEYAVCVGYLGDLEQTLEGIRRSYQTTLEIAQGNISLGSPQAGLKAYADYRFGEATSRLLAILEGVGRRRDADRVREFVRAQGGKGLPS